MKGELLEYISEFIVCLGESLLIIFGDKMFIFWKGYLEFKVID